jgi:hypothetical protein
MKVAGALVFDYQRLECARVAGLRQPGELGVGVRRFHRT